MGGGREEENVTGTKIREIEREKKKRKKKTMYCLQDSMCDGVTREDYNISG